MRPTGPPAHAGSHRIGPRLTRPETRHFPRRWRSRLSSPLPTPHSPRHSRTCGELYPGQLAISSPHPGPLPQGEREQDRPRSRPPRTFSALPLPLPPLSDDGFPLKPAGRPGGPAGMTAPCDHPAIPLSFLHLLVAGRPGEPVVGSAPSSLGRRGPSPACQPGLPPSPLEGAGRGEGGSGHDKGAGAGLLSFPTVLIGNPWLFPCRVTQMTGPKRKTLDSR